MIFCCFAIISRIKSLKMKHFHEYSNSWSSKFWKILKQTPFSSQIYNPFFLPYFLKNCKLLHKNYDFPQISTLWNIFNIFSHRIISTFAYIFCARFNSKSKWLRKDEIKFKDQYLKVKLTLKTLLQTLNKNSS